MPRNPGFPQGRPAGPSKVAPLDPRRVRAATYDVMRAPSYVQQFPAPVRPGAMDFKRIASKCFAADGGRHG